MRRTIQRRQRGSKQVARRQPQWMRGIAAGSVAVMLGGVATASVWTGNNSNPNWNNNGNPGWNGTGVPNGVGAVATKSDSTSATILQNLGSAVTLGEFSYTGSGARFDINGDSANALIFDNGGSGALISNSGAGAASRIDLGTSVSLTLNDNLRISNTSGSGGGTSTSIGITSIISGTGRAVTVSNNHDSVVAGAINIGGINTFTGSVLVEKGALAIAGGTSSKSGLGDAANAVTLGSAGNGNASIISTGSVTIIPQAITVTSGTGGTLVLGSSNPGTTDSEFSGTIALGGDLSITSAKTGAGVVKFSNVISGNGTLTKIGSGAATLSGVNTYTGNTNVDDGSLGLLSGGELRFKIQNANASNSIIGDSTVSLNGIFRLNVGTLTASMGTWNLVNVNTLTESFGGSFNLAFVGGPTFSNAGGGVYTSGDWSFSTVNGNLTLIPEPGSLSLLSTMLGGLLWRRSRRV